MIDVILSIALVGGGGTMFNLKIEKDYEKVFGILSGRKRIGFRT